MNWTIKDNKLERNYVFNNFNEVIDFVNKIAKIAEELDHHPDILIHSYKEMKIMISTHDQEKITEKDYELAERIDSIKDTNQQ